MALLDSAMIDSTMRQNFPRLNPPTVRARKYSGSQLSDTKSEFHNSDPQKANP